MTDAIRRVVVGTISFLKTTWLIIGSTLLLLLVIEIGVRIATHRAVSTAGSEPVAKEPWYPQFRKEFDDTRAVGWRPYVYFRRFPLYKGQFVNSDSEGRRITPQPSTPATPIATVYFFGGSTMWGSSQRDDHTIAAESARRLQSVAGAGERIAVMNFGEQGWVFTQEIIELELQLRAGARPDVVVFYDGINDVFSTVQNRRAGIPENEDKRVAEFNLGRTLDRTLYGQGVRSDLRALGILAGKGLRHLETVDQLQGMVRRPAPNLISADSGARSQVNVYAENVRLVEALAAAYGFTPLYVWQPTIHGTDKVLTKFEERLVRRIDGDPFNHRMADIHLLMPALLDSAITPMVHERFVDAFHLFKGDSNAYYADDVGHNTEVAIPKIVDSFWPVLQASVMKHGRLTQRTSSANKAP